jgi:hypothetical protein
VLGGQCARLSAKSHAHDHVATLLPIWTRRHKGLSPSPFPFLPVSPTLFNHARFLYIFSLPCLPLESFSLHHNRLQSCFDLAPLHRLPTLQATTRFAPKVSALAPPLLPTFFVTRPPGPPQNLPACKIRPHYGISTASSARLALHRC